MCNGTEKKAKKKKKNICQKKVSFYMNYFPKGGTQKKTKLKRFKNTNLIFSFIAKMYGNDIRNEKHFN